MRFTSKFLTAARPNRGAYLAFKLSDATKQEILDLYTPRYKKVDCDHVTLEFTNPTEEVRQEFEGASMEVVGYQFGPGTDCLVVKVNGSINRPDGGIFHITLSVKGGHKAVESNDLLKLQGYNKTIPFPITGTLEMLPK